MDRKLFTLGSVVFSLLFGELDAQALRCGTRLVSTGHSRADVLALCGRPDDVNQYVIQRSSGAFQGDLFALTRRGYRLRQGWRGPEIVISVQVDEWLFNFGSRRLMQRVTFENGRVERIEALGYGWDDRPTAAATTFFEPGQRYSEAPGYSEPPRYRDATKYGEPPPASQGQAPVAAPREREVHVEAAPEWR